MKLKWNRFDNWFVKATGFFLILGGLVWTAYSVVYHYRTRASDWEYFPFVVGGLAIVFGAALLAQKATAGATAILLPLLDRIRPGLKPGTSTILVPPQPAQPARPAQPAQPAKVVTTTVTPLPDPVSVQSEEKG